MVPKHARFLTLFLALLSYSYANKVTEEMVAVLMEIHASTRENLAVLGGKLAPLKYSKGLRRLAEEWVNACQLSRPTDPRFASLGSNVVVAPAFESVVHKWRNLMSSERLNYNLATGECTAAPCEHFMQVVQPNITHFGCAVGHCVLRMQSRTPVNFSVCLYQAEGHGVSVQQEGGLSTTAHSAAPTTAVRGTAVIAELGAWSKSPSSAPTLSSKAEHTAKYFADHFITGMNKGEGKNKEKELEEGREEGDEGERDRDEGIKEESHLTTPTESTSSTVQSNITLGIPLLDIDEMEEVDDEEEGKMQGTSKSVRLSLLLPSFAMLATALLS